MDYNSVDWNEVFYEDADSPSGLRWRIASAKKIKAGSVAGSILTNKKSGRQCFQVNYNKTSWYVHRILWVMRNGEIDAGLAIDHIDGNAMNNSADNLRLVSTAINSRNQKQSSRNYSGTTGVHFNYTGRNTYVTACWHDLSKKRKSKHFSCAKLGLLEAFAAACAYREKIIDELNKVGAGYSDRHGTIQEGEI